jgi:hypothetical protein
VLPAQPTAGAGDDCDLSIKTNFSHKVQTVPLGDRPGQAWAADISGCSG